jgi:peptidoglycan hydrolase-like protein with peptidoglycan-binding domain
MAENWIPGAIRKEIAKFARPHSGARGCVGHIAVSEAASLFGYFSGAEVCSTVYIRRGSPDQIADPNGMADFEQYVPLDKVAPANFEGNTTMWSFESQGGVTNADGEAWDDAQVRRIVWLLVWLHQNRGMPLDLMADSRGSSRGYGPHRLGISPWRVSGGEKWSTSNGKRCPGNVRVQQGAGIVESARALAGLGPLAVPVGNPTGNGGTAKNWLQRGDSGPAVAELQRLLTAAGFPLEADGVFGPLTEEAVKHYQASRNLVIDGLAGAATLGALRAGASSIATAPTDPVLRQGSKGPAVGRLQRFLNSIGAGLVVDDDFGPETDAAVHRYQAAVGLTSDGVVGPLTWAKVNGGITPAAPAAPAAAVLRRGSSGAEVSQLQAVLNRNYPAYSRLTVDGAFGPATEAVVKEFQRRSGLAADGIVGPLTRAALGL